MKFIVLKHASTKVHLILVIVWSSTVAKKKKKCFSLFWVTRNLHSSARLVGHPAVHSIFPADREGLSQCFSADSSPEQQIERLRIPLTDVCDHCSSEIKWKWAGGQRFNSQSRGLVLRQPAVLVLERKPELQWKEAPSSGWTASFHTSGSLGVDMLQTRDGWISLWVSSQTEQLSLICSVWVMVLWWIGVSPISQS